MTTEQPRTYEYQLTADEFTFAFTANAEEFVARADELRARGMERLTGTEIRERYGIILYPPDSLYTFVGELAIKLEPSLGIIFENIQTRVPDLIIWRSFLPTIIIRNCKLGKVTNEPVVKNDSTSFWIIETEIGGFTVEEKSLTNFFSIDKSVIGNVSINESTIGDFHVMPKSIIGDLNISKSTTGKFPITESVTGSYSIISSTTGEFSIIKKSTTGDFLIMSNSTTGLFTIENSKTDGFLIMESKTGDFSIQESTTGSFTIMSIGEPGNSTTGNFSIQKSTTGLFAIIQSTTGRFSIVESITGGFSIVKSTTGNFLIKKQSKTGDFLIEQSKMSAFTIIEQSTTGSLSIVKNSTTGDFLIEQSTISDFSIDDRSITGKFDIKRSTTGKFSITEGITGEFNITEQSTIGNFLIKQSVTNDFTIAEQSTVGNFLIEKSMTGDFSIKQSKTGDFNISDESSIGEFLVISSEIGSFEGQKLYNSFSLRRVIINQFVLNDCHIPELKIESSCKTEASINNTTINTIDFRNLLLSSESVVSFLKCEVYACLIQDSLVSGNLYFRQLRKLEKPFEWYHVTDRLETEPTEEKAKEKYELQRSLLVKHADNYDKHITKLKDQEKIVLSTFRIARSSLGKTEFTDCNLSSFQFEFNNAKISEIFVSGGTVPENIFIYDVQEETVQWQQQRVSAYNQFKKIFEGQGDVYLTPRFQTKTAEHQKAVLKLHQKGQEIFSTTLWDLNTFRLNGLSNRHGESWGRALLFTLLAPLPFYLLFLLAGERIFIPTDFDWKKIWTHTDGDFAGYYFTFLDPTHKIDFLKDKGVELTGWSSVVDFLGRIVVGYGIYQFISAFRKHGKK